MRLISLIFILLVVFCSLNGADIIKNKAEPLIKNSGKTLALKEVMRIHDKEGEFYFKYPKNIKISSDGSIFVRDDRQLLKFDSMGKFRRNFHRHGQGPQEVTYISNYLLVGTKIVIHDSGQNKIVIFNHENGNLIKEFKILAPESTNNKLFFSYNSELYFLRNQIKDTAGKLEIKPVEITLISLSTGENHIMKKKMAFPTRYLTIRVGDRFFSSKRAEFLSCSASNDLIYISHTPAYEIKLYSFKTNSIIRKITRAYKRIEVTEETKKYAPGGNFGKINIGGDTWYEIPKAKYQLDIQKLLYFKKRLWVITSTVIDKKKVLVDTYDENGIYYDNFYLECPPGIIPYKIAGWINAVKGDFLYVVEEDEDGHKIIKKYNIGEGEGNFS